MTINLIDLERPDDIEYASVLAPAVLLVLAEPTLIPEPVFCEGVGWLRPDLLQIDVCTHPASRRWRAVLVQSDDDVDRYTGPAAATSVEACAQLWVSVAGAARCPTCGRRVSSLDDGCPPVLIPTDEGLRLRTACAVTSPA